MNAKFQVFLSSTYDDLRIEREQVIRAILEMGHIPVGMEMFSAADEEQWKLIARQIDESDYYVVVVAHRYGSVVGGISYTEKEYDYAIAKAVPVIGFIIDASAPWPGDRTDKEAEQRVALDAFKSKIRRKPIGTWTSATDLYGKVSIALMKLFAANPRPGWVRATAATSPETIAELTRLSSENAQLRGQLSAAWADVATERDRASGELLLRIRKVKVTPSVWYRGGSDWTKTEETTLFDIFLMLAPQLITECSSSAAAELLGFTAAKGKPLRDAWPMPYNLINAWLADLLALGLLQPSVRRHPVADKENYWSLTEKGRCAFAYVRNLVVDHEVTPPNKLPAGGEKETSGPPQAGGAESGGGNAATRQHSRRATKPKGSQQR